MKEQNFSNHVRIHPLYHYFIVPVSLLLVAAAVINLFILPFSLTNVILVIIAVLLHLIAFIARDYAKKNQDRIIRTEMQQRVSQFNNRSFLEVSGKLSFAQLAALRFAPDKELVYFLSDPNITQFSASAIKQQIKNWQPDYMRV